MKGLLLLLWNHWKKIAHAIGVFQSRVILTIFYLVILFPVGILLTHVFDLLNIKGNRSTSWVPKEKQAETLEELREQY